MNPGLQRHLLWVGCLAGRLQIFPSLLELLPRAAPSCPSYPEAPFQPPQRRLSFRGRKGRDQGHPRLGQTVEGAPRRSGRAGWGKVKEEEGRRRWWLQWLSEGVRLG